MAADRKAKLIFHPLAHLKYKLPVNARAQTSTILDYLIDKNVILLAPYKAYLAGKIGIVGYGSYPSASLINHSIELPVEFDDGYCLGVPYELLALVYEL